MKNLMILTLLLIFTVGCKSEAVEEVPVKELTDEEIEKFVAGLMIFMGNDYNEDDVVEVDGKPGRIVRCGVWSTTFFTYDVVDGIIVGGSKLVIQNDKLKDIKIEKPLPLLDLSKYKVDTSCVDLLTELTRVVKKHENNIQ